MENDEKLASKTPVLKDTEKFTVYIKNSVAFPYFGRNYRKNNILSEFQSLSEPRPRPPSETKKDF